MADGRELGGTLTLSSTSPYQYISLTIDMGLPVPSGIHGVTRSEDSERCYDINGRLLQAPPAKGLYIRGKKKTVRK